MIENFIDPVVLFFLLGLLAGILRSNLRLPEALYETLSIFLLLSIGIKGGVQLATASTPGMIGPLAGAIFLGVLIPIIAYPVLRRLGRLSRPDSAAMAAHYGSVSAVTFTVVLVFLDRLLVPYEGYTAVLLVTMEVPAIVVGILIARLRISSGPVDWRWLFHEVFLGKSTYLLVGGLAVGFVLGPGRVEPIGPVFFDLFNGALAFFLLEMGLVTSQRLRDLRQVGLFLVGFGIGMPLLSGILGTVVGTLTGLSVGGTTVLATLAASASYIAAPAAVRIAIPEANATLYLTASLGITFPFNVLIGIPVYYWMAQTAQALGG